MRVSQHSGRSGSARHNDRDFELERAAHIHAEKTAGNLTWSRPGYEGLSFKDMEQKYYSDTYGASQAAKNERYVKDGHPERCRTTDDLLHGAKTRPEEMILQIGDRNSSVGLDVFKACLHDYYDVLEKWNSAHGRPFEVLNTAIHTDEVSLHCHIRRVWHYNDGSGLRLGQNKALKMAADLDDSFRLPKPEKKEGRYNNLKITFDLWARKQWQEICKAHGLEIETTPVPGGRKHDRTGDFIRKDNEKAMLERDKVEAELVEARAALAKVQDQRTDAEAALAEAVERRDVARADEAAADEYAQARRADADAMLGGLADAVEGARAAKIDGSWMDARMRQLKEVFENHTPRWFGVWLSKSEFKVLKATLHDEQALEQKKAAADAAAEKLRAMAKERVEGMPESYRQRLDDLKSCNQNLSEQLQETRIELFNVKKAARRDRALLDKMKLLDSDFVQSVETSIKKKKQGQR